MEYIDDILVMLGVVILGFVVTFSNSMPNGYERILDGRDGKLSKVIKGIFLLLSIVALFLIFRSGAEEYLSWISNSESDGGLSKRQLLASVIALLPIYFLVQSLKVPTILGELTVTKNEVKLLKEFIQYSAKEKVLITAFKDDVQVKLSDNELKYSERIALKKVEYFLVDLLRNMK